VASNTVPTKSFVCRIRKAFPVVWRCHIQARFPEILALRYQFVLQSCDSAEVDGDAAASWVEFTEMVTLLHPRDKPEQVVWAHVAEINVVRAVTRTGFLRLRTTHSPQRLVPNRDRNFAIVFEGSRVHIEAQNAYSCRRL
jgi:hypothetical protein